MTTPNTVEKGKESTLPPIATLAAQIRDGADITVICARYRISRSTLQNRFNLAGYTLSTGEPHAPRHDRPEPLQSQHIGAGGQHVGGGDYHGLPTAPVQYRGRRQHNGLNWDQINADYIARDGQVDASVWPKANGKVVIVGGSANSSKANIHTFAEADEYDEPAAPKKRPRARKTATSTVPRIYQVQPEQRPEIARRYDEGESIPVLAKAYDVSEGSIRYAIKAAGGRIRTKQEAAALYRDRTAS